MSDEEIRAAARNFRTVVLAALVGGIIGLGTAVGLVLSHHLSVWLG